MAYETNEKEIYRIEYSAPPGLSNEEVLWYLHLIAMEMPLEDGELQGKQLSLSLVSY